MSALHNNEKWACYLLILQQVKDTYTIFQTYDTNFTIFRGCIHPFEQIVIYLNKFSLILNIFYHNNFEKL